MSTSRETLCMYQITVRHILKHNDIHMLFLLAATSCLGFTSLSCLSSVRQQLQQKDFARNNLKGQSLLP
jgi:hypothetical protein